METEDGANYLIATPEKALCDLINFSKGVNLRFMKDVAIYLEKDIRFDMDSLSSFDGSILDACSLYSRKSGSINILVKFLRNERYI